MYYRACILLLCLSCPLTAAEDKIRITDIKADNLIGIDLAFAEVIKEFKAIKVGPGKRMRFLKDAGIPRKTGKPMVYYNIVMDGKQYGYDRGLGIITHFDRKWQFVVWSVHNKKQDPQGQ